jgi:hypothetical protein
MPGFRVRTLLHGKHNDPFTVGEWHYEKKIRGLLLSPSRQRQTTPLHPEFTSVSVGE